MRIDGNEIVCFEPTIDIDGNIDIVITDGSFTINRHVENTGNVTGTQQIVTKIILEEREERVVKHFDTAEKELSIGVNETVTLASSVVNVGTDPWQQAAAGDVFTIELET